MTDTGWLARGILQFRARRQNEFGAGRGPARDQARARGLEIPTGTLAAGPSREPCSHRDGHGGSAVTRTQLGSSSQSVTLTRDKRAA